MEKLPYEKRLGTVLVAVGLGVLLFGLYQAYIFTVNPPAGQYFFVTFSGAVNGSLNGRFIEAFSFLLVEYLVGASILRAGWNLITPKAETIQVRVKPRSLQVEDASPAEISSPAPATASPSPSPSVPSAGLSFQEPTRAAASAAPWAEESRPPSA